MNPCHSSSLDKSPYVLTVGVNGKYDHIDVFVNGIYDRIDVMCEWRRA